MTAMTLSGVRSELHALDHFWDRKPRGDIPLDIVLRRQELRNVQWLMRRDFIITAPEGYEVMEPPEEE